MNTLSTPLKTVLGGNTAKALADKFELHTVEDLLRHYPRRYHQRGEHTDLAELAIGEQATVLAQVARVSSRQISRYRDAQGRGRKRTITEVVVTDGRQSLNLTYFNQQYRERELRIGRWGLFAGKVGDFRGQRQLQNAEYQLLADESSTEEELAEFTGAMIPVYPAAKGLPSWTLASCVRMVLTTTAEVVDPLPAEIRDRMELVALDTALRQLHEPTSWESVQAAKRRLAFDEAFALQVTLAQRRTEAVGHPSTPRPGGLDGLLAAFDARLPFKLTDGQQQIGEVVAGELARSHPMNRLLQGEVGSGKTVCALRAMLQVIDSGGQAALLAPTEVLATQHHRSIRALLGPLAEAGELGAAEQATRVALLTGSQPTAARRAALAEAASGEAGIVIGTHALLSEGVEFADLGLVVVDEQHRFGVEQRDVLRAKGQRPPHVLVMTATPIPRTVAITVYGDLEVSELSELPAGRAGINSHVVPATDQRWMDRTWQRVREEAAAGHRAYVVCPRIGDDESGKSGSAEMDDGDGSVGLFAADDEGADGEEDAPSEEKRSPLAVLEVAPQLMAGPLADLRVGILHGRLPGSQKDAVMSDFAAGRLDVLIATTVIEVGVDVPAATVMVVLDADRFGVSQLHQLRGRVGRGAAPGLCLLVTESAPDTPAGTRLSAVASTLDGFRLAELDLAQRREGDVLGATQSGRRTQLKVLSLVRHQKLITEARQEATTLVDADPTLAKQPALAEAIAAFVNPESAEFLEKG